MNHPELIKISHPNQRSFRLISKLILLGPLLLLSVGQASADPFFNSAEPGCNGSDPNKLFCEDFETPGGSKGRWYAEDCDTANKNGGIDKQTKGWCGSIFANPITPFGAETASGEGVGGGYAGNHGTLDGKMNDRNMAHHRFKTEVDEIYVRYYQKWLTGYVFGAEKVLTFNTATSGGIKWGNLHINCGTAAPLMTGQLQWQPRGGTPGCKSIVSITPGNWYYIEVHAKLSTTNSSNDGFLRVWANNCGATGTACGAMPTLRLDQQKMSWDRNNSGELFGDLWFENWANPVSTGISYIDQIVVSRTGPIGFFGAPPSPTNLKVQ